MRKYLLPDGNIILADAAFVSAHHPGAVEVVEPAAAEPENAWWIYVGPFYDRFGAQKLPILSSADPTVAAIVRDSAVRKYIDLKRAELPGTLDLLIAAGFAIDKVAILTTPVPEADRYKG